MISKAQYGSFSLKPAAERNRARISSQEFERHHVSNEDLAS